MNIDVHRKDAKTLGKEKNYFLLLSILPVYLYIM